MNNRTAYIIALNFLCITNQIIKSICTKGLFQYTVFCIT